MSYFKVAIPFRVGWGFSPQEAHHTMVGESEVAIPFRVGWGFSREGGLEGEDPREESQSLSGWDGVFHEGQGERAVDSF